MDQRSVFFEEWLRSLREQYKHVVRIDDKVTLPTLTAVMQSVGFGEDELTQLRLEATMHVDDIGEDFVPDMHILEQTKAVKPHPVECLCPQCSAVDESSFDADGQPIAHDPEAAIWENSNVFPAPDIDGLNDDETDSITFEDSLTVENVLSEDGDSASPLAAEEDIGDTDDDPESPQQMSLF